MTVAIINCGARKKITKCPAREMYIGNLFVASRNYVESIYGNNYCILSAKYHLLFPDDEIMPYDMSLRKFTSQEKCDWWKETAEQLLRSFSEDTVFHFYASMIYIEGVLPILKDNGRKYKCFLNDTSLGYKVQWFQRHTKTKHRKLF